MYGLESDHVLEMVSNAGMLSKCGKWTASAVNCSTKEAMAINKLLKAGVGTQISVQFKATDSWRSVTITDWNSESEEHEVQYENDSAFEWLNLNDYKHRPATVGAAVAAAAAQNGEVVVDGLGGGPALAKDKAPVTNATTETDAGSTDGGPAGVGSTQTQKKEGDLNLYPGWRVDVLLDGKNYPATVLQRFGGADAAYDVSYDDGSYGENLTRQVHGLTPIESNSSGRIFKRKVPRIIELERKLKKAKFGLTQSAANERALQKVTEENASLKEMASAAIQLAKNRELEIMSLKKTVGSMNVTIDAGETLVKYYENAAAVAKDAMQPAQEL